MMCAFDMKDTRCINHKAQPMPLRSAIEEWQIEIEKLKKTKL